MNALTVLILGFVGMPSAPALDPGFRLTPAFAGPAECSFVVPADFHPGAAEWIGPCAGGHAEGVGVLRVAQADGKAELFYGEFHAGLPRRGMFGDSEGNFSNPTHSFSPRTGHSIDDNATANPAGQDAKLWALAAAAARGAAVHFESTGNRGSAGFYRARAKALAAGPPE